MHLVLMIGIQATGKSSFCRQQFFRTHVRINLDMLKTRHREGILFQACLSGKAPVLIDNTNLARNDRQRYIVPAKQCGYRVSGYYFQSELADAIERNELRSGTERVPRAALCSANSKLEIPSEEEGFDDLHYVRIESAGFVVEPWENG